MAWNYRKRIKILPGVHLNVSKKGVSTTFGVRGASITTSKRGTYLNTSIPGTGIYKRQKISGGANKAHNDFSFNTNAMTNNNVSFMKVGLVLSWIVLIVIALLIVSQNTIIGICFISGIIVIKIVTKQKKDFTVNNQENTVDNNNSDNELIVDNSLKKEDIYIPKKEDSHTFPVDKTYFDNINQAIEKLFVFYKDLESDVKLETIVYEVLKQQSGSNIDKGKNVLMIFWSDIITCYTELGYPIDLKSKEGLGLLILSARCFSLRKEIQLDSIKNLMDDSWIQSIEVFIKKASNINNFNLVSPEKILLSSIFLAKYDVDLYRKFLILLYRFSSITAKADGTITEKEEKWLNKLLQIEKEAKNESSQDKKQEKENVVIFSNEQEMSGFQQKSPKIIKTKTTKLRALIGLDSVKEEIETLTNFIKIRKEREEKGLKNSSVSYHCVFTGNPGTGKTTVARIVAEIYKNLGILSKGHLVETDRSGLVAEYVGQTAVKTNNIIDTALDGVLFIDEAYSLISKSENDYGKEAIATLLKRMEDNRDRLVVILAGYTEEMQTFIDSNPGLQSRFNRYIEFPDYSAEELLKVFELNLKQFDYKISNEAKALLEEHFIRKVAKKERNFGNARFARNLFEKTIEKQANRLSKEVYLTEEKLSEICSIDLPI